MCFTPHIDYEVRPMKKFIQLSAAVVLVAALASCGTAAPATTSGGSPSASATAAQAERAVPDVTGMTYKEAYEALVKDDFFAQVVDETGATWTTGNPWDDVKVASTDPQAGTMTDVSHVKVTLQLTQAEYGSQTKAAK